MKLVAMLLAFFMPMFAFAGFPKNNLDKEDCLHCFNATMTEKKFNEIIDSVTSYYEPIVASHGASLKVNRLWTNPTVNASAEQTGSSWSLNMYGGLARRPEITEDGFALVVCHELGHHLGGFSFYKGMGEWAANEGQSDYFSTQSCAKNIWKDSAARTPAAAQSLANLLAKLSGERSLPSPDKPDQARVRVTYDAHPAAQCRLDTYLAGMKCSAPFLETMIPGKNHVEGQQSFGAQAEAYENSCASGEGSRPRCWFAPVR